MELFLGFVIIGIALFGFGNGRDIGNVTKINTLGYGNGQYILDVTKFGAIGDGKKDDSKAFLKAWSEACEANSSPTLQIPGGKSFLLQPLEFKGPCKSPIHVKLEGNLVGPDPNQWSGDHKDKWVIFHGVENLIFDGSGKIDGRGEPWWKAAKLLNSESRPTALAFQSCKNLQVKGITSINSPRNHISISGCNNATISNVNLIAPDESPNTDGIDVSTSSQINIFDSFIGTGDDCVAINGGSVGINIKNVFCGPGHGLSVGSLGQNGEKDTVEQIRIQNCTFNRTQNGARIKTWPGGSGYAKNISFEQIILIEAKNPIIIDQYYGNCFPNCPGGDSMVKINDVKFMGFQGTSANKDAIKLDCHVNGCTEILLENIDIESTDHGKQLDTVCKNAQVTSKNVKPPVSCSSK